MDGLTAQVSAGWLAFLVLIIQMLSLMGSCRVRDAVSMLAESKRGSGVQKKRFC